MSSLKNGTHNSVTLACRTLLTAIKKKDVLKFETVYAPFGAKIVQLSHTPMREEVLQSLRVMAGGLVRRILPDLSAMQNAEKTPEEIVGFILAQAEEALGPAFIDGFGALLNPIRAAA